MRLSDLQDKDIVSISDGKKIGSIIDVNIDEKGIMKSLVVEENKFMLFCLLYYNKLKLSSHYHL